MVFRSRKNKTNRRREHHEIFWNDTHFCFIKNQYIFVSFISNELWTNIHEKKFTLKNSGDIATIQIGKNA